MNKQIHSLLFCSFFLFTLTLFSQTEKNPWQFSFGFNAIDTFPTGAVAQGDLFEEFFNVGDHWNLMPIPSQIGITNYIGSGFSFGLRLSLNSISKYGNTSANNDFFGAADAIVKYDLNALLKTERFSPFIETGGGYAFFDEVSAGYFNLGFGIEYALGDNKKTILFAESLFRNTGETYGYKHFQHSLGLAFRFGNKDKDEDGVVDKDDRCPEIPGLALFEGCPDLDGDGIQDSEDSCPEVSGLVKFNGCPDSDDDGIEDSKDNCPEIAGLALFNGCPDSDGDGVEDTRDECPDTAGNQENNGCPEQELSEVLMEVPVEINQIAQKINFPTNSAELTAYNSRIIDEVYDILSGYKTYKIEVQGHTDNTGGEDLNMKLSQDRAKAVVDYLISKGISRDNIYAKGYGESSPIESNSTARGRYLNRRVEFKISN